ncbi:MAG: hypothetical protein SFX18_02555 [Pirellulales bacterium]|nr:hypothetical protein [Pirellulales bacterium]
MPKTASHRGSVERHSFQIAMVCLQENQGKSMFRCLVAILALVGFILGQWAAISHAHAGMQSADHSAMPHVHISWLMGENHEHHADHGHCHGQHEHRHATNGHGEHQDKYGYSTHQEESTVPDTAIDHVEHHGADAIYLTSVTTTCEPTGRGSELVSQSPLASAGLLMQSAIFIPATNQWHNRDCKTMPKNREHHCARFLELRTLRI